MDFNTQVCTTREQSERLLALGLKKETADCCWLGCVKDARGKDIPKKKQAWFTRTSREEGAMVCGLERFEIVSAWSLHRLIAMCPNCTDTYPCLHKTITDRSIHYCEENNKEEYEVSFSEHLSLYDNIIACIEWLIENNHFNKEYLEETK